MGTRGVLPLGSYGLFYQKEKPPGSQSLKKGRQKYNNIGPKLEVIQYNGYNPSPYIPKDTYQSSRLKRWRSGNSKK